MHKIGHRLIDFFFSENLVAIPHKVLYLRIVSDVFIFDSVNETGHFTTSI